jgi:hypothetical protein
LAQPAKMSDRNEVRDKRFDIPNVIVDDET